MLRRKILIRYQFTITAHSVVLVSLAHSLRQECGGHALQLFILPTLGSWFSDSYQIIYYVTPAFEPSVECVVKYMKQYGVAVWDIERREVQ